MRKSTKAVLLSGLVFPGLGHLYLRRYVTGILLVVGAGLAIYLVASGVARITSDVINQLDASGAPIDVQAISELVSQRARGAERAINLASLAFLVLWIIGVADCWRSGRQEAGSR